tara:strand:- start:183 stop:581 length:399 start_codon:yes stop_codon:yes gene_type:complete
MTRLSDLIRSSDTILVQASGPDTEVGRIIFIDSQTLTTYAYTVEGVVPEYFSRFENLKKDKEFMYFITGISLILRCSDESQNIYFDLFQFNEGTSNKQKKEQLLHYSSQVIEEHKRASRMLAGFEAIGFIVL